MAKKTSKTKNKEVVTVSDNQQLDVANCDRKNVDIKSLIRVIRGQQVMLDSDLAMLYGVETRALNQAVKRNINRFPEDFMFQLTKGELELLKSQIAISKSFESLKDNVLISQIVTSNTSNDIEEIALTSQNVILKHQMETDEKIELILDKIEEIAPKQLPEQIFQTGCVWDAWTFVSDLVRNAKKRIVLIDNFVDDRVLSLLDKRADGVTATIHSRYYEQFQTNLKKHNEQYPVIGFVQLPHKNHDRFLIIDDEVYFLGASLKDVGTSLCAVKKMEVSPDRLLEFLK